jgi:phosphoribosyl 1,2-cyclic phosphodiesterase
LIDVRVLGSGSSGNCYVLDDGHSQLIIEAGIKFNKIQQALAFDFSRVAGCLISHEHGDHSKAIKKMTEKTVIDFYASQGTFNALGLSGYHYCKLRPTQSVQVGSWLVMGFPVEHDAAEPMGFVIENQIGERLLYVTDTYFVRYRFKGITHMLVEANYSLERLQQRIRNGSTTAKMLKNRLYKSHFEIKNTLGFIRANKSPLLQQVWLIHLSDANADGPSFKKQVAALTGVPVHLAGW